MQKGADPVTASCAMAFRLYDDAAAGRPVGAPLTTTVAITAGLFTVALDFGTAGQPAAGRVQESAYDLCAGFWCRAQAGYGVYLPLVCKVEEP